MGLGPGWVGVMTGAGDGVVFDRVGVMDGDVNGRVPSDV